MSVERRSGILLHPTSLPSLYGIGDFGPSAYDFVDFLERSGQRLWQMLPLGPTGYGDSPYQTLSAFGGNPLLISPQILIDEGLLDTKDISPYPFNLFRVEYDAVNSYKLGLLKYAYTNFQHHPRHPMCEEFELFCEKEAGWLEDYVLFFLMFFRVQTYQK